MHVSTSPAAPIDASYLTQSANGVLSAEAVLTAGTNITLTPGAGILTIDAAAGGSGAPTDATYITQVADATLTNEQALSALATGLLKNTAATGVLSIGVAGTDYPGLAFANVFTAAQTIQGPTASTVPLSLKTTDNSTTNPLLRLLDSSNNALMSFGGTGLYTAYKASGSTVYYFTFGYSPTENMQLGFLATTPYEYSIINHVAPGATAAQLILARNGTTYYAIASDTGIATSISYLITAGGTPTIGYKIGYSNNDIGFSILYDGSGAGRAFFSLPTSGASADGLQWRYDGSSSKIFAQVDLLGKHTWRGISAITNTISNQTFGHNATGTPVAGFGTGLAFQAESSTTENTDLGRLTYEWVVATHASRASRGKLSAYYISTERAALQWTADSVGVDVIVAGDLTIQDKTDLAKQVRFNLSGITTGNTRVLTPPNQDTTLAGQDFANVFTSIQKINVNSTAAFLVEQDGVKDNVFIIDTTNGKVAVNQAPPGTSNQYAFSVDGGDKSPGFSIKGSDANFSLEWQNTGTGGKTWQMILCHNGPFNVAPGGSFTFRNNTDGLNTFTVLKTGEFGIGTTTPATQLHALIENAATNTVTNVATLGHNSTGTPAAAFGTGLLFQGESSTTIDQNMARLAAIWDVATHASRSAALQILISGTSEVTAAQFDDDATAGNTRLLLYDVDNGQLERVSVGIADSGGAGFKLLRIAN